MEGNGRLVISPHFPRGSVHLQTTTGKLHVSQYLQTSKLRNKHDAANSICRNNSNNTSSMWTQHFVVKTCLARHQTGKQEDYPIWLPAPGYCSCLPYCGATASIRNLSARQAILRRGPVNIGIIQS